MREPGRALGSLGELFAVLHAMEQQAAARYAALAERMRAGGSESVAAVFQRLAEEEQDHVRQVRYWCESQTRPVSDSPSDQPDAHEPFDADEIAELGGSGTLTPYRALSLAVRGEERAFAFWSYVSARAPNPAVKEAAEKVAHQELEHAALLRRERRRAYRAERGDASPHIGTRAPHALLRRAAALEQDLAPALERLAAGHGEPDAAAIRSLAEQTRAIVAELWRLIGPDEQRPAGAPPRPEGAPVVQAETVVELYLAVAEQARDEALVAAAQSFAAGAIARLSLLRELA